LSTQIFLIYIWAWPLSKIIYRQTEKELVTPNGFSS